MFRNILISLSLVSVLLFTQSTIYAKPLLTGDIWVRVCYDNPSCASPTNGNSHLRSLDDYVKQVLANEWHNEADLEALKAGAVAIRTFAYRTYGCGAYIRMNIESPVVSSRLVDNRSQTFKFGGYNGTQKTVTTLHVTAGAPDSAAFNIYRADGTPVCAKYFANVGDPTHSCITTPIHPQCPSYPNNDTYTLYGIPDTVCTNNNLGDSYDALPGMSQNGSVAWAKGEAPWDYRQILSHYYRDVKFNSDDSSYYRWAWLNVGNSIEFEGYSSDFEEYYVTDNPTPDCLYVNGGSPVTIHVQNTSRQNWSLASTKLSYRWYNSGGTLVNTGAEVGLPSMPKGDDELITAALYPPPGASAGQSYTLKWDLKRGSTWFSSQNSWPTLNKTVCMLADTTPPHNPPQANVTSGSGHVKNDWTGGTQISLTWSGASDGETWVSGYSIVWNQTGNTTPDTTQDTSGTTATSNVLGHGNWYLHVRTRDNAGNWASGATHYGPYGVDTVPPQSQVSNTPTTSGKSWLYLRTTGTDSGAGVASVLIQYKIDNGAWQNYVTVNGGEAHTVLFTPSRYNRGHRYYFRTQATDRAGLVESVGSADFYIDIASNASPDGLSDAFLPLISK